MKALLLAATSTLALTGFAMAQTATTTTTTETPAAAASDAVAGAADKAEDVVDQAGNPVDEAVTTSTADAAEDAADRAEDAADAATTAGASTTETTTTETTTTAPATTTTTPAETTVTTTTDPVATTTTSTEAAVVAPDVQAPVMSAENPGMLGSYIMNRRVWTTNQPSSTAWADGELTERPADWTDIAKVDDIVMDPDGNVLGFVADIGGFLGLGAKSVLLGKDALHFVQIGDDAFFATNFTKEELQALPDFDRNTVLQ